MNDLEPITILLGLMAIIGPIISALGAARIAKSKTPQEMTEIILNTAREAVQLSENVHQTHIEYLTKQINKMGKEIRVLRRLVIRLGGDSYLWENEMHQEDLLDQATERLPDNE